MSTAARRAPIHAPVDGMAAAVEMPTDSLAAAIETAVDAVTARIEPVFDPIPARVEPLLDAVAAPIRALRRIGPNLRRAHQQTETEPNCVALHSGLRCRVPNLEVRQRPVGARVDFGPNATRSYVKLADGAPDSERPQRRTGR